MKKIIILLAVLSLGMTYASEDAHLVDNPHTIKTSPDKSSPKRRLTVAHLKTISNRRKSKSPGKITELKNSKPSFTKFITSSLRFKNKKNADRTPSKVQPQESHPTSAFTTPAPMARNRSQTLGSVRQNPFIKRDPTYVDLIETKRRQTLAEHVYLRSVGSSLGIKRPSVIYDTADAFDDSKNPDDGYVVISPQNSPEKPIQETSDGEYETTSEEEI